MNRDEAQAMLARYLFDEELGQQTRQEIEQALHRDPELTEELQGMRRAAGLIQRSHEAALSEEPAPRLSQQRRAGLLAAIRAEEAQEAQESQEGQATQDPVSPGEASSEPGTPSINRPESTQPGDESSDRTQADPAAGGLSGPRGGWSAWLALAAMLMLSGVAVLAPLFLGTDDEPLPAVEDRSRRAMRMDVGMHLRALCLKVEDRLRYEGSVGLQELRGWLRELGQKPPGRYALVDPTPPAPPWPAERPVAFFFADWDRQVAVVYANRRVAWVSQAKAEALAQQWSSQTLDELRQRGPGQKN